MIIQSSRVNLASSREYTYSSGRNLTRTTTYGGRTNSFSQTWEKSYTARQDYYSSSGSDSYPATDSPGISYGLDKDGTLKIMDEETTEKTDSASETESVLLIADGKGMILLFTAAMMTYLNSNPFTRCIVATRSPSKLRSSALFLLIA